MTGAGTSRASGLPGRQLPLQAEASSNATVVIRQIRQTWTILAPDRLDLEDVGGEREQEQGGREGLQLHGTSPYRA